MRDQARMFSHNLAAARSAQRDAAIYNLRQFGLVGTGGSAVTEMVNDASITVVLNWSQTSSRTPYVMNVAVDTPGEPITVVLNWDAELKK